jgi:hypothetical protein
VGKTIPSYRIALENEIQKWNSYAKALRAEEREAFEKIMDACRNHASASGNATNPIIFEPMAMSIMLDQQLKLTKIEKKLDALQKHPMLQQ